MQVHVIHEIDCSVERIDPAVVEAFLDTELSDDPMLADSICAMADAMSAELHPRGVYKLFNPAICTLPPKYTEPAIKLVGTLAVLYGSAAYERMSEAEHTAMAVSTIGTDEEIACLRERLVKSDMDALLFDACLEAMASLAADKLAEAVADDAHERGLHRGSTLETGVEDFPLTMNTTLAFFTQTEKRLGLTAAEDGTVTLPAATLQALAAGDLSRRSGVQTQDELGALAREFDAMAARQEANFAALKATMEGQDRFIGSFTHELKTPMTSILGYADLLRRGTLSPEEQANAADYIFSEGKRLERLSLKLLELYLAEHQALSLVPAAPADLLQDLTAHLSPGLARQGIVLTTQWEPGLCLLEPDLFRSLVLNLIDNSRKAIGAQGTISISCQMTERGCRLTVQDTGRGMPPEVLSHLTEAFYRVDKSRARAQGGAGLGLALCEKIAVLHQGRITFESTLGQGTTVTVSLEGGRP